MNTQKILSKINDLCEFTVKSKIHKLHTSSDVNSSYEWMMLRIRQRTCRLIVCSRQTKKNKPRDRKKQQENIIAILI